MGARIVQRHCGLPPRVAFDRHELGAFEGGESPCQRRAAHAEFAGYAGEGDRYDARPCDARPIPEHVAHVQCAPWQARSTGEPVPWDGAFEEPFASSVPRRFRAGSDGDLDCRSRRRNRERSKALEVFTLRGLLRKG